MYRFFSFARTLIYRDESCCQDEEGTIGVDDSIGIDM